MRNVLLTVSGLTPQIVTETLWALTQWRQPAFVPNEIIVVTTDSGRHMLQTDILSKTGALADLCREYEIPLPKCTAVVLQDRNGTDLPDIRDLDDNVALANGIVKLVRDLTSDPDVHLHASLAGGRKTMGFYLGYAMSLFGRPQDSLSHVLVSPEFESSRDFWYIPRRPTRIPGRSGDMLDTQNAKIELAEIPFLRLRARVDEPLLNDPNPDFSSVIENLQATIAAPTLELFDTSCEVHCGEACIKLAPQQYAMYRLMAEVAQQRRPGAGPDGIGPKHRGWLANSDFLGVESFGTDRFISILTSLPRANPIQVANTIRVLKEDRLKNEKDKIQPEARCREIRSRMNTELKTKLSDYLLWQRIGMANPRRKPARFGLLLRPEEIRIHAGAGGPKAGVRQ